MLPLIDSAIGFAAIMLVLCMLVKSLTSVIKNYADYYSENLRAEVDSFLQGVLGKGLNALASSDVGAWLKEVNWKCLGEEFLTVDKMKLLIKKIGPGGADLSDLETRLELHVANLKYAYGQRMKNLALAAGLGLCLFLNINSFTIWKTLYTDQQIRGTFASQYADKAMKLADELSKKEAEEQAAPSQPAKDRLKAQSDKLKGSVGEFLTDVSFGVGRVWRETPSTLGVWGFFYEFLGSLLTGILVSIGAPYWHDLLRALGNLRNPQRG